jgi:hypothetical protein
MKMDSTAYWFSPTPTAISSSRLSLDFGLRAADLFFRELVVPELGRVWFVRQLSWPAAALALHDELQARDSNAPKPTAICHGIESLACKLEFYADPEEHSDRLLGSRAFGRDQEQAIWLFHRLRQASNYVRNTHRQAAMRAMRPNGDGGLGLATGSRFDLFKLEAVGRALAEAFLDQRVGQGGTSLRKWLIGWILAERELPERSDTLVRALSPEHPSDEERGLVRSRVLEVSTTASETRQYLARAVGHAAEFPKVEEVVIPRLRKADRRKQADELTAARSFGEMLDRARNATAKLTRAVEEAGGGRAPLVTLARDPALRKTLSALRAISKNFSSKAAIAGVTEPDSRVFADAILAADDEQSLIRLIVLRSGQLFGLADGAVIRGALFQVVDATMDGQEEGMASIEPDRTGRYFRMKNLHSLLRDVRQKGTA